MSNRLPHPQVACKALVRAALVLVFVPLVVVWTGSSQRAVFGLQGINVWLSNTVEQTAFFLMQIAVVHHHPTNRCRATLERLKRIGDDLLRNVFFVKFPRTPAKIAVGLFWK